MERTTCVSRRTLWVKQLSREKNEKYSRDSPKGQLNYVIKVNVPALPQLPCLFAIGLTAALMMTSAPVDAAKPVEQQPLWPAGISDRVTAVEGDVRAQAAAVFVPVLQHYRLGAEYPRPAIIICPGGGYGMRAGHEGEPLAKWANSLGFHGFVCQYRVNPWLHPAPLNDLQRAIRIVRANATAWGVDPRKIAVLGFSAGGHLVSSAACFGDDGAPTAEDPLDRMSSRANALVACYPVISFGPFGHVGSRNHLLGKNQDPDLVRQLSLENSVTSAHPPAFLWHTSDDAAVPVENSLLYAQALRAAKVPFALEIYPHGCHGLGLATGKAPVENWTAACAAWFRSLGW